MTPMTHTAPNSNLTPNLNQNINGIQGDLFAFLLPDDEKHHSDVKTSIERIGKSLATKNPNNVFRACLYNKIPQNSSKEERKYLKEFVP